MKVREEHIAELVERLRQESKNWKQPNIILIGGYALRAYIPFARYSRDCDFALPKGRGWKIDKIQEWLSDMSVAAQEKHDEFAYLCLVKQLYSGKHKMKIFLDFMEGQIMDRSGAAANIDKEFIFRSKRTTISIANTTIPVRVPSYEDFFLLKVLSGRASDIRDIAAMIWKKETPKPNSFTKRAEQIITKPTVLKEKLQTILKDISHPQFTDSWKGTYITQEFTEKDKQHVWKTLQGFLNKMKF